MGSVVSCAGLRSNRVVDELASTSDVNELSISIRERTMIKLNAVPVGNMSSLAVTGNLIGNNTNKILSESEVHKYVADQCLKAALSHPVVIVYFRAYTRVNGNEDILDFYLDASELRKKYREHLIEGNSHLFHPVLFFI